MVIAFVFLLFFTYIGVWLLLQHYHANVLMPFVADVVNQVWEKQQIATVNYHEDKLMPAMSLLAAQKAPVETNPPVVEEPPKAGRPQPLKDAAQIDKIWDQVKAAY